MQVYRRIANPFMPNGTPDLTNSPSPYYAPGEIGGAFSDQNTGGEYLRVQLDSGATNSVLGAVVAGQVAFWKDQLRGIVTNDKAQCDVGPTGAINRVAGFFQTAVKTQAGVNGTDGLPIMYMCDLVLRKTAFPIQVTGTIIAGGQAICDTTASTARAIAPATVSTAPVSQVLGVFSSATVTNNTAPCDVAVGFAE